MPVAEDGMTPNTTFGMSEVVVEVELLVLTEAVLVEEVVEVVLVEEVVELGAMVDVLEVLVVEFGPGNGLIRRALCVPWPRLSPAARITTASSRSTPFTSRWLSPLPKLPRTLLHNINI